MNAPDSRSLPRRDVLKLCAGLLGGGLSASITRVVMASDSAIRVEAGAAAHNLTAGVRQSIELLVDMIIPATDTPGALAAGVPRFVESLLTGWYTDAERDRFLGGLAWLDRTCTERAGNPFAHTTPEERDAVLAIASAEAAGAAAADESEPGAFFRLAREAVVVGFFTSEVGAREVLTYVPVPGRYDGHFPVAQVSGHWSY